MFNIKDKKEIIIQDQKIRVYSSFYTRPNLIFEKLLNIKPAFHKNNPRTYNGKKFLDLRHTDHIKELDDVISYFEDLVGETCNHKKKNFTTNMQKWFKDPFNDYKNNYWWPHRDDGYTLLIYLNEEPHNGLNLYQDNAYFLEEQTKHHEHVRPWHSKKHYELLKCFKTPFNTAILFPAHVFLHGCAINNDFYFDHFRLSQAIFFEDMSLIGV